MGSNSKISEMSNLISLAIELLFTTLGLQKGILFTLWCKGNRIRPLKKKLFNRSFLFLCSNTYSFYTKTNELAFQYHTDKILAHLNLSFKIPQTGVTDFGKQ